MDDASALHHMNHTITTALIWATHQLRDASTTARLDAELLLAHVLGYSRARLLAEGQMSVPEAALADYQALIARRANLEPVAYLIGQREFYGLDFFVNPHVLVPRPETELLVELALEYVRGRGSGATQDPRPKTQDPRHETQASEQRQTEEQSNRDTRHQTPDTRHQTALTQNSKHNCTDATSCVSTQNSSFIPHPSSFKIADICTGSGCIAVALAQHLPNALIYATDISGEALELASRNIQRHGLSERIRLIQGDMLARLPEPVDLLVSNPPYTIMDEIDEGVRRHEPHLALDGGLDGLEFYRRICAEAPQKLRPNAAILLEIGAEQGQAVAALARAAWSQANISIHRDLAGHERVVQIHI